MEVTYYFPYPHSSSKLAYKTRKSLHKGRDFLVH